MKPVNHDEPPAHAMLPLEVRVYSGPLRVAELMSRDTLTLQPDQSVADAVSLLANRSIHHVLVVDDENRLHGVISDRDVLRALARTPDWNQKRVSEIMTEEAVTVGPDTLLSAAVRAMLAMRINCLPVVGADERVCGILTSTDLLNVYEKIQARLEDGAV